MTSAQTVGWRRAFAKYPGIKLLEQEPVPTMWDPAVAQQKTAALIAKYPQIDGMFSETVGPIRAFVAAGRPIPVYAGQSLMDLSCIAAEHPEMKMMSLDAHTWMVRLALRKAVAAAQGIDNDEPSLVRLSIGEDTTSKDPNSALKCDKSMPMESIPSSMLSKEQQIKALGAGSKSNRILIARFRRGPILRRASSQRDVLLQSGECPVYDIRHPFQASQKPQCFEFLAQINCP